MVTSNDAAGSVEAKLLNDDLPAAFWDAYPENPDNTDLQAISALLEESTPEERAETYKVRCLAQLAPVELLTHAVTEHKELGNKLASLMSKQLCSTAKTPLLAVRRLQKKTSYTRIA